MQFGHAVRARALKADDNDDVAVKLSRLERGLHVFLCVENAARRFSDPAGRVNRTGLERRAAQIASHQPHTAVSLERTGWGAEHRVIRRLSGGTPPCQRVAFQHWLFAIIGETVPADGHDIPMQMPRSEQFPDHKPHPARRVEMVHIA